MSSCRYNVAYVHSILACICFYDSFHTSNFLHTFDTLIVKSNTSKTEGIRPFCLIKYVEPGINARRNVKFTFHCIALLLVFNIITWLLLLLLRAGEIQPNPGPRSVASSSGSSFSSNLSTDFFSHLNLSNNLSFVQYNVQSVLNKLDVLQAEFFLHRYTVFYGNMA